VSVASANHGLGQKHCLQNSLLHSLIHSCYCRLETETSKPRSIHAPHPRITQRLRRRFDRRANQPRHFIEGGRRIITDVDDKPIHCPRQRKLHRACNVSLMNQAERLCRVPLEPCNERWHRRQMSIPIPVDKTETKNAPVQSATARLALRSNLARRIRKRRMSRVLFKPRMVRIRIGDRNVGNKQQSSWGPFSCRRPSGFSVNAFSSQTSSRSQATAISFGRLNVDCREGSLPSPGALSLKSREQV
jgi:hypothetical protein